MELSDLEMRVVQAVGGGLDPVERPFAAPAARAGVSEDELISTLASLGRRGILRRISAILSGEAAGKHGAALVAWRVEGSRLDDAARKLAAESCVSHCVARKTAAGWPYNLYTMFHGDCSEAVSASAAAAAARLSIDDYVVLETVEELKKTPPVYCFEALGRGD